MGLPVKSLSPTKVDCYFGCKRLFKYRYIKAPFEVPENKYFLIGSIAHKALENFHKGLPNSGSTDIRKLMSDSFRQAYQEYKVPDKIKSGLFVKNDVQSIHTMLKGYLEYYSGFASFPKTVFIERLFNVSISDVQVWGKADRVDKLDDCVKIVDYKTNSKPFTKNQIKESVQLPTYGIWLRRMGKIPEDFPIYGEYIYLKHMGTKREAKTYEITDALIADAIEKYSRVVFELKNGAKFPRNTKYQYCFNCDYKLYCNRDGEDGL